MDISEVDNIALALLEKSDILSHSELWNDTEDGKLVVPLANKLLGLYSNIENLPELTQRLFTILEDSLLSGKENRAALSFYCLFKLSKIDFALETLQHRPYSTDYKSDTLCLIIGRIAKEYAEYFSLADTRKLRAVIDIQDMRNPTLKGVLAKLLIDSAEDKATKKIEGVNLEINRNKEAIIERIGYLGFDPKYVEMLNQLDSEMNSEDRTVTAGMIGNLRSFFETFSLELAQKIAAIETEEIPKLDRGSPVGDARRYLKIKLELSDKDDVLLTSFINVLHSEGGHSFVSNSEYFRLSKNIGIELVFFLIRKYEVKYVK